ncbi:protein HID1-like isoform X2 [Convolutriloba macropyga]|uniref:protein HID1-like isoform X2 n=1 Tax=Convolutriloba macropyga TaxID=536237 RepID=UPI003F51F4A8
MGNADTKLNFRKAVIQLTTKTQPIEAADQQFWEQFWAENVSSVQDVFALIPAAEIRALREESPSNLATLCYKAVERLVQSAESGCCAKNEQAATLNCVRLMTRILPYIFEDPDWRGFFWSSLPSSSDSRTRRSSDDQVEEETPPLAQSLLNALADLLFCPDFSVHTTRKGPHTPEDLQSLDSCEYIWASGVGFAQEPPYNFMYDMHRTELLKLLLTCFSEAMYMPASSNDATSNASMNPWISYFTSSDNRHALPLFTSLLNIVSSYDPVGYGVPYNHLMFRDYREPLVQVALQLLIVTLDHDVGNGTADDQPEDEADSSQPDNLFVNYLSRIHRDEDFNFILHGLTRLLNNPLQQTYLPNSIKKIQFHQELLVFLWKFCDANKKFLFHVLKSSEVLELLVPILYHLNDARADQWQKQSTEFVCPLFQRTKVKSFVGLERPRVGLMHIGVFILLLLSGERNFGVRLNKPYNVRVPMDIPVFTGTHADLLIIVFHKIITTGHQRLQPLFDCLLTIICNVSPYLKSLSMVASNKLLHLLEAFSTPWFLISSPTNHHLVFFLLESFNNIIQYQFDGNSNLIYTIIRKRHVFHQLSNLPTDHQSLMKIMSRKRERRGPTLSRGAPTAHGGAIAGGGQSVHTSPQHVRSPISPGAPVTPTRKTLQTGESQDGENSEAVADVSTSGSVAEPSMEGSRPAQDAEPGTLKASLAATPDLDKLTEKVRPAPPTELIGNIQGGTTLQPGAGHGQGQESGFQHYAEMPNTLKVTMDGGGPVANLNSNGSTGKSSMMKKQSGGRMSSPPPMDMDASNKMERSADGMDANTKQNLASPRSSVASSSVASHQWIPTPDWANNWKSKLPLQTIMRLLQVLVPQVEKICIDKGLTDESEILRFLQHGTLVGLLPVPHPILIRKYQSNAGTAMWFRTYMWGIIYLRNIDPPIWYDTDVKLFEIQRV